MMQKVNKGEFNVHPFFSRQKAKKQKGFVCSLRHLSFSQFPLWAGGECAEYCVCVCWCAWFVCAEAFPTNAAHNTYACYITTPIRPSLSPSIPKSNSFISPSLLNKAPIHCPANQSVHSCSQLSMTRFIWLALCPSHQPSSFSIL